MPLSSPKIGTNILIFCDGACSGNPGRGGWGIVVATPTGKVRELGGAAAHTTNNKMELSATIAALRVIEETPGEADLFTDSVYVIRGITQWIWAWQRKGWTTADGKEVQNRELWQQLAGALFARKNKFSETKDHKINWHWVKGHSGVPGNERVDAIAVAYSQGHSISLYRGPLLQYGVPLYDLPASTALPERSSSEKKPEKTKAHSYLSLIGTVPARHATWGECERRVKGQSGAKFKKTTSEQDEQTVLRGWGVDPAKLKD